MYTISYSKFNRNGHWVSRSETTRNPLVAESLADYYARAGYTVVTQVSGD